MSVNFYSNLGVMVGSDIHFYFSSAVIPVLGAPIPFPYVVGAPFVWPPATWFKRTGQVTADSVQMIQGGFDLYVVPHVPFPGPPAGLLQVLQQIGILAMAGSKAVMNVHSVTGEKEALAVCLVGCVGANVDCNDPPFDLPSGYVLNLDSVKTTPSLGDYIGAIMGYAADVGIGKGLDWGFKKTGTNKLYEAGIKHLLRRLPDLLKAFGFDTPATVVDPAGFVQNLVQKIIDREVEI